MSIEDQVFPNNSAYIVDIFGKIWRNLTVFILSFTFTWILVYVFGITYTQINIPNEKLNAILIHKMRSQIRVKKIKKLIKMKKKNK